MRPRLTEIDYAIIAVAPLLIMVLVGSLVLFATGLFYDGQHELRLNWILCMFVLGIVSTARVSIEEGMPRALPLGFVLGVVVAIAVARFVPEAVTLTLFLLAVVWWVSTRLVYDCTVLDQSVDASQKGLMQWIRREKLAAPSADVDASEMVAVEGVTGRTDDERPVGLWAQLDAWVNPTNTRFAPGAWVVYFSLGALPIFGLGQAFARDLGVDRRWYLFLLLVTYVFAALCLLVTTSFLGLRRYLQQRGVVIPLAMTGTWLGVGFSVVALVLIGVSLLPRPNAEYQLAQLPFYQDWHERQAAQVAVGRDGVEDTRADRQPATDSPQAEGDAPASSQTQGNARSSGETAGDKPSSGESGDRSDPNRQPDAPSETAENETGSQSSDRHSSSENGSSEEARGKSSESEAAADYEDASTGDSGGQSERSETASDQQPDNGQAGEGEQSAHAESTSDEGQPQGDSASNKSETPQDAASSPPPLPPTVPVTSSLAWLVEWLKVLFYLSVVGLVLFLLWKYRADLAQAWGDFWAGLWGKGKRASGPENVPVESPITIHRPFSSFANPFQDPGWKTKPPEQWIRYSFTAVEAWAYERGHTRGREQTPSEFATMLEHQYAEFGHSVRKVAELYGQVAYGSGRAPRETLDILRKLWQQLRDTP